MQIKVEVQNWKIDQNRPLKRAIWKLDFATFFAKVARQGHFWKGGGVWKNLVNRDFPESRKFDSYCDFLKVA